MLTVENLPCIILSVNNWKEFELKVMEINDDKLEKEYLKDLIECKSWDDVERFAIKYII